MKVRVGIVGLGLASGPHLKGYIAHPRSQVVAVCDADRDRAQAFAEEHRIPAWFDCYERFLKEADLDAVDIVTPTHLHAPMTLAALEAAKHVHCEKPFCRSVAEGRAAQAAAEDRDLRLAVGETYVHLSSHRKARELIEAGEIGRPKQVRQRHGGWVERRLPAISTGPADRSWRTDAERSGGGRYPWIFDHAVHFFATAELFMLDAPIVEVYAQASGEGGATRAGAAHDPYSSAEPDIPTIVWRHADGTGQGVWVRAERLNNRFDHARGFSTTIVGETGMSEGLGEGGGGLVWGGEQQHLVLHREGQDSVAMRFDDPPDAVWESEIGYYSAGHNRQIGAFVDSIVSGSPVEYGAVEGTRAIQATLATILAAKENLPVRLDKVPAEATAGDLS